MVRVSTIALCACAVKKHVVLFLFNFFIGDYNFKRFLACVILRTIRSVMVFFPGNLLIAASFYSTISNSSCIRGKLLSDSSSQNEWRLRGTIASTVAPPFESSPRLRIPEFVSLSEHNAACRLCKRSDQPKIERLVNNDARLILR